MGNNKYMYDEKSDSLFIYLKEGEEEDFEEIVPGINVELDKNRDVIGIEVLHASRFHKQMKKFVEVKH